MEHLLPSLFDMRFYYFLFFTLALLSALGSLLIALKYYRPTREASNKIWIAYKPWFIIAPLCFLSIGIGGPVLIGSLFILSFLSIKEFAHATGLVGDKGIMCTLYAGTGLIYSSVGLNWYPIFTLLPIFLITALLLNPPLRDEYKNMLPKVGLSLIAMIYLAWFPAHLAFFAHHKMGYLYLLFLVIGTELNDASAYLSGKLFGKRLLVPNVSPKKTIEGSIGAFITVSCYVWLVHSWVPGFHYHLCFLSILLLTVGGTLGDLIMSFFKRDLGIKDLGNLIPGHGGLLDRIDSLLLISPFYFYMILYIQPLIGEAI